MQRLKEAAEKAKIELSGVTSTNINLPYITADATGPKHLDVTLTRAKFNELTADLVEETMAPVRQALKRRRPVRIERSDKVLLVGGSTRIPAVQEAVKKHHRQGAASRASTPMSAWPWALPFRAACWAATSRACCCWTLPRCLSASRPWAASAPSSSTATPPFPTRKSQIFSTAADDQTSVEVNVLQGEREMAADNKTLGRFHLDGIAPARRGVPQIEVTFDIDANGIVNVSAKDLGTGKEQHITITASSNLSKDDIDKAVKEAEQYRR